MLKRNFQTQPDDHKYITVEDAYCLANAACREIKDNVRSFARSELGWEIWKNPRLAAPVARELFQYLENATAPLTTVYGTLLTVIENGLGKDRQDKSTLKIAQIACFNPNPETRSVASWTIIKHLEEAQRQTAPYTYAVEQPLHSAV